MSSQSHSRPEEHPPKQMKIKDAKELFASYRKAFQPDYEALVKLFRLHGIPFPVDNSNYLHALSFTDLMFHHTDSSLRMLTGSLTGGVPDCLRDSFEEMLARINKRGGAARIIEVDGDRPYSQVSDSETRGRLQVLRGVPSEGARLAHFIVCDNDMVREEEPHAKLTDDSDANEVKAKVYFSNKTKAVTFSARFDAMWRKLSAR